jgi:hypothetical protein
MVSSDDDDEPLPPIHRETPSDLTKQSLTPKSIKLEQTKAKENIKTKSPVKKSSFKASPDAIKNDELQ